VSRMPANAATLRADGWRTPERPGPSKENPIH
jgi:hypothetical protein